MTQSERCRTNYLRAELSQIADMLAASSDGLNPTAFNGRMLTSRSLSTMAAKRVQLLLRYLDGEAVVSEGEV